MNSPFKRETVLISNDILFHSMMSFEKRKDLFLSDILYLSILLENFVLHDNIVILSPLDNSYDFNSHPYLEELFNSQKIDLIERSNSDLSIEINEVNRYRKIDTS